MQAAAATPPGRLPVFDRRRAGVLLHVSSLIPSRSAPGVGGALGAPATAFIDWLADAGFSVWQILPLGDSGVDGSPYWARSDYAGNPLFIGEPAPIARAELDAFRETARPWLDDYTLFVVLSQAQRDEPWWAWPVPLRDRDAAALARARIEHAAHIARLEREQCAFAAAWRTLRAYAHSRGVRLFGDLPIYVAPNSVETWASREAFQLDAHGQALAVAGVPPDYFSETGQLWGNPLYDWARMRRDGFSFWRARIAHQLARFDVLRIDHFRALAGYWSVPAGAPDARGGTWQQAQGRALLRALREDHLDMPFIAEDLGVITADVVELRKAFGFPGMRVLQCGFNGDPHNLHLPHNHTHDGVVYTGTHDNDTTAGWYASLDGETLRRVNFYLRADARDALEALTRAALGSVAALAVLPMQDVLGLGSYARLNIPGTVLGNWSWRLDEAALSPELARRFAFLNRVFGRNAHGN
ncbi:MAG TPA: 4-alpha-glucanotransferase [Steroidobacteraceae bacterium]